MAQKVPFSHLLDCTPALFRRKHSAADVDLITHTHTVVQTHTIQALVRHTNLMISSLDATKNATGQKHKRTALCASGRGAESLTIAWVAPMAARSAARAPLRYIAAPNIARLLLSACPSFLFSFAFSSSVFACVLLSLASFSSSAVSACAVCENTALFFEFSYVCPEPVLVK